MINIAIVEDMPQIAEELKTLLASLLEKGGHSAEIHIFYSAEDFLQVSKKYDIVFMDIELPGINGMNAAHTLREQNNAAVIIFVTSFTGFAVEGFSVSALDYIVKPFNVYSIEMTLRNALKRVRSKRSVTVSIPLSDGICCFDSSEIIYIETYGHKMIFHTGSEVKESWGSLRKVEEMLIPYDFVRIHRSFLVNMRYITGVTKGFVNVANEQLPLSYNKSRTLIQKLNSYLS